MTYQIQQGDSLTLLRGLDADSVDALITDPPYSSGGMYRGDRTAKTSDKYQSSSTIKEYPEFYGDTRDMRGWLAWCALWLAECHRVLKDGAPVCLFVDWRMLPTMTDAFQAGGFVWRGVAVWDKTGACRPQKGRFAAQAEYVVWGSKGGMPIERQAPALPGVFSVSVRSDEKFHITGKPVPLMRQLVKVCEPGGVILDPFMGSGSTGVAALQEGYRFLGFEMSDEYRRIAEERLQGHRPSLTGASTQPGLF